MNFADDRIRTADVWCQKRSFCQLDHNHCPTKIGNICGSVEARLKAHSDERTAQRKALWNSRQGTKISNKYANA